MNKKILILCLSCIFLFPSCYETRRGYTERRGLMLLRTEEYARNQGIYKPAKKYKKNLSKKIKKLQKR
jgi:hypothetical protein